MSVPYTIVPNRGMSSNLGEHYVTQVNTKRGALSIIGGDDVVIDNDALSVVEIQLGSNVPRKDTANIFTAKQTMAALSIPLTVPGSPANGDLYLDTANDLLKVYYDSSWITINNSAMQIGGDVTGTPNAGSLLYIDGDDQLAQNANLVVDDSSGIKVGIGVSSPSEALEVNGTVLSTTFQASDLGSAGTTGDFIVTADEDGILTSVLPQTIVGSVAVLKTTNTGPLVINSSTTLRLDVTGSNLLGIFINNSGYVGVATTSPDQPLTVNGLAKASNFVINSIPSSESGDPLVISGASKQITNRSRLDFPNIELELTTSTKTLDPTGRVVALLSLGTPWQTTDRLSLTASKGVHGQILTLQWIDDVNPSNPIMESASGVVLASNWQPTKYDTLTLLHISTSVGVPGTWYEIARTTLPDS